MKGTGAGGRITKQDLEALSGGPNHWSAARPARRSRGAGAPPAPPPLPRLLRAAPVQAAAQSLAFRRRYAGSATRDARRAHEHHAPEDCRAHDVSKHTSAHVTTVHRVDMTKVAKLRDKLKGAFQAQYGFSLTFLPFVVAGRGGRVAPVSAAERLH